MPKPTIVAIALSDLHLTLLPPACRADKSWLEVQANYLQQVKALELKHHVPILCAGDIFDRWNAPPELIHFALKHLPDGMYCIPGQHDLPNHRMDLMHRSGYGVLVEAGKIKDVVSSICATTNIVVYGYGWNEPIEPLPVSAAKARRMTLHVALVHRYVWTLGSSYPGAPLEDNIRGFDKILQGYDVAVFGDNHRGFLYPAGPCSVFNCGGFIRRKSDEKQYRPQVGLIYSDGTVAPYYLDTSADRFREVEREREEAPVNLKEFIEQLEGLGEHGVDFREAVKQHLKNSDLKQPVVEIITELLQ